MGKDYNMALHATNKAMESCIARDLQAAAIEELRERKDRLIKAKPQWRTGLRNLSGGI